MKDYFKRIIKMIGIVGKYIIYLVYVRGLRIDYEDTWLISERGDDARDNSFHLFKYIRTHHPEVSIKYVINKKSPDYKKVVELGPIIEFGSREHYIHMLASGMLISTHIMGYTPDMSLFSRLEKYGLVFFRGKRVFLRHGISKDYIPHMAADVTKLDLIVAGAKPEFDYAQKMYGHPKGVVQYTGFPRFDGLESKPKRQILLMPTFRKWLNYTDNFTESDYYRYYDSLLKSSHLRKLLESYNYTLIFYPHYEIQKRIHHFSGYHTRIVVADLVRYDVQELLLESKLLITDYSSVFFDFSYMNKPVIYYQFDIEQYRQGHYRQGYFSYEEHGFGPVVHNEEDLLTQVERFIERDMALTNEYADRTRRFFPLMDKNNSSRVYTELKRLVQDIDNGEGRAK